MLETRRLAYFVAACQHLHLAKAAEEVGVAQSTLSMALKSLEEDLSLTLFASGRTGLIPTSEATWLYQAATPVLHAESFARSFAGLSEAPKATRIAIHPRLTFAFGRFAKAVSYVIEALQPRFPSTLFELQWRPEDARSPSPGERAASITIEYDDAPRSGQRVFPVMDDPWVLARELPVSTAREPSREELLAGPVIVPALPPALIEQATRYIAAAGLPNARFVRSDPGQLPRLASDAPDTSFLVPHSILSTRLGLMRVRSVPIGPALASRIVARADGDMPEAAIAFVDKLREHLTGEERNAVFSPQLTLRQVRYLKLIHDSRRITAAAAKANIAQAALSSQLHKMERTIGRPLFERQRDGLVPTQAGERLYQACEFLWSTVDSLERGRLEARSHAGGVVRLGILPAIDHTSEMLAGVSSAIARWRALHPAVDLQTLEAPNTTLQRWLLAGKIGIAIVETDLPQLARFNLGVVEEMAAIVNPRFALLPPGAVAFADLSRLRLILPTTAFGIRQEIDKTATTTGVRIRPHMEINSLPLTISLVRDNPFATILPASAVRPQAASGELRVHPIVDPNVSRRLYAIYSGARALTPPERDMIRLLRAIAADAAPAPA